MPRGGPDGGDGGRGGNVVVAANEKTSALEAIRNNGRYTAKDGKPGTGARKAGRHGDDLVIEVPPGTAVYDIDSGELIGELHAHGDRLVVAAGGTGGRGNCHFATPQNRVPQEWEPGTAGESRNLKLVYSIPADAAVVGLPGAGKSSLVRMLTRSNTKVGEYPFTTKTPQIGVCKVGLGAQCRILDMPALTEGSSEGRGIGNRFLGHLNRVDLIIYVLDCSVRDEFSEEKQLDILKREIEAYDAEYLKKKELLVINKVDLIEGEKKRRVRKGGIGRAVRISAKEKLGKDELVSAIADVLELEQVL